MQRWVDFQYKIKQYFGFSRTEIVGLIATILTVSFIISFREWGRDEFSLLIGLGNWFHAILISALTVLAANAAQRLVGLYHGYKVEYKMWTFGLLFGLLVAFLSYGRVWFLVPGGVVLHHLAGHRLGYHRYGPDYYIFGAISFAGTLGAMILGLFFKLINIYLNIALIDKLVLLCIVYALYDLIPLPTSTGAKLFFGSRLVYVLGAAFVVGLSMLMLTDIHPIIMLIVSGITALLIWFWYYWAMERFLWKGPYAGGWAPKSKK